MANLMSSKALPSTTTFILFLELLETGLSPLKQNFDDKWHRRFTSQNARCPPNT